MKYILIDKIQSIEPGKSIVATKNLTLAEEYLQDHFPSFPVIPGVLMLEGMIQSAAWLVRLEQNFEHSIVVLKAAKNVKYSYFLRPGCTMRYEVQLMKIDGEVAKFKASGYVGDRLAVSARLELMWQNLAEKGQWGADADKRVLQQVKKTWDLVGGPQALEAATEA
ncbi:MAG: beta-hydroxyacyl-ACP dehydratase [Phycisphaerales bacterium]|jgi:3-hydroxyacyl-[acyl-carrier-protein] dehydratase|nr:beta-hydroxyacyl-ACP dehydratase [Phycisphaerales bacterium]MBT7170467.1 beta-hydroxyacyl-ACP dehydratase [Phycisphaerales bacterium]